MWRVARLPSPALRCSKGCCGRNLHSPTSSSHRSSWKRHAQRARTRDSERARTGHESSPLYLNIITWIITRYLRHHLLIKEVLVLFCSNDSTQWNLLFVNLMRRSTSTLLQPFKSIQNTHHSLNKTRLTALLSLTYYCWRILPEACCPSCRI